MGQRLIFQCLSFPFTISLCKWPTSPVPGVSNSSPKIKDDQIQNAPSLSQSPRGIYEGCTTRTGPNSHYCPPAPQDPQPTLLVLVFPTPTALGSVASVPSSVTPSRSALVGALYSAQETNVNMTPSCTHSTHIFEGDREEWLLSLYIADIRGVGKTVGRGGRRGW